LPITVVVHSITGIIGGIRISLALLLWTILRILFQDTFIAWITDGHGAIGLVVVQPLTVRIRATFNPLGTQTFLKGARGVQGTIGGAFSTRRGQSTIL
jgi:hypothetical protein